MSPLRPELVAALERLHPLASAETLPGDASTRRFHRIHLEEGSTRIVMDYGAPFEEETDDVRLARIFERAALPVAHVLDVLPEAGALVLEDLGDTTLETALERAESSRGLSRPALYRAAIDIAGGIATRGSDALRQSDRASGPALDAERFEFEMRFFLEHFIEGFLGRKDAVEPLRELLMRLADEVASHPRVMCHRDFHSRNLMVRGDGTIAMVDIQDARWGPDTYDVASLLRDAYVALDEREVTEFLDLYGVLVGIDLAALRARFRTVAAQRMIKALGTFGYQVGRLGRERYRPAIPLTLERLSRLLPAYPETAPLAGRFRELGIIAG